MEPHKFMFCDLPGRKLQTHRPQQQTEPSGRHTATPTPEGEAAFPRTAEARANECNLAMKTAEEKGHQGTHTLVQTDTYNAHTHANMHAHTKACANTCTPVHTCRHTHIHGYTHTG